MTRLFKKKIKLFLRIICPPYKKVMHFYVKKYYDALSDRHKFFLRAKEMERREAKVIAGNDKLMEQIEFLKYRVQSLDSLHESVAQRTWPHDGSLCKKKCLEPFRNIDILPEGQVYTCCSAFLKHDYYIGNIYEQKDFDAIWNSDKALKLRHSVSNGNFEYCQGVCKYLRDDKAGHTYAENGFPIVPREESDKAASWKDCRVERTPQVISLSCDKTCNLHCPSCRTGVEALGKEESEKLYQTLERTVRPMLKGCKVFHSLGSGELFASAAVSRFYKTLSAKEFPDLTLSIITNMQLLTPAKWDEFKNLREFPLKLIVSVDAAKMETYERLRLGGKWERLVENLEFFREWRKRPDSKIVSLSLNFIVQEANFREIEGFCRFGQKMGADSIWFQRITNWGTYTDEEFGRADVCDASNPNCKAATDALKAVLAQDWPFAIVQNIL